MRARAEAGDVAFRNIDSFLLWQLTGGVHVTDCTNASRTQLMNLRTLAWDPELLEAFDIPPQMLPRIARAARFMGRRRSIRLNGVPIAGILGDQQAALAGQACFHAGEAKNTYGTGCFLLMNTGFQPVESKHGLLTTVAYKMGNRPAAYALEEALRSRALWCSGCATTSA